MSFLACRKPHKAHQVFVAFCVLVLRNTVSGLGFDRGGGGGGASPQFGQSEALLGKAPPQYWHLFVILFGILSDADARCVL